MRYLVGQQDGSGAGPEDWLLAEFGKRFEEVFGVEELQHSGALAARNDEAVEAVEVGRGANEYGFRAGPLDGFAMRLEVALEREDAYFFRMLHQPRVCISSPSAILEISSPGMPMPSSSLASSSL